MKRDRRFSTLGEAFDYYHELAPNVRAPGSTIEEKVEWYEHIGEEELLRLNAATPPPVSPASPAPPRALPSKEPGRWRGGTIEMQVDHFRSIAPEGLVPLPAGVTTLEDKLHWYRATGETELARLAESAVAALRTELAGVQSAIAGLDRKIAAAGEELAGHHRGIASAWAELEGINALPSIVEFNRIAGEVAQCDQRIALVDDTERLLLSFAGQQGVRL